MRQTKKVAEMYVYIKLLKKDSVDAKITSQKTSLRQHPQAVSHVFTKAIVSNII
jgi:hypothetical protein